MGLDILGLEPLTGFATFNLLVPLAVVNGTLIYSRRNHPDLERGFRMPLVPVLPVVGILANLALIANLPFVGVVVGAVLTLALVAFYLVWGGGPHVEELVEEVVPRHRPAGAVPAVGKGETEGGEEEFRILVAVARPVRAVPYVRLAAQLGRKQGSKLQVQVLNVTHVPDQTPNEIVREAAQEQADQIGDRLSEADLDVEYTVEGHICRDVAFDILQTARNDAADRILMGYPEEHPDIAETVEYNAPCGVFFTSNVEAIEDFSVVNVGAGGGPHHIALLPLVNRLGEQGAEIHVISIDPEAGGTEEPLDETIAALSGVESIRVHNVTANTVAEGLVATAVGNGGLLLISATRNRRLRRWVFGSTPDQVIDLARAADLPVLLYASSSGVSGRIEDYLYPIYRYFRRRF